MKDDWARTCRTMKYLVDLYQARIETKDKNGEVNFTSGNLTPQRNNDDDLDNTGIAHLDVADFSNIQKEKLIT